MKEVGLYDAKTRLSALVAELESGGEPIAFTRHGKIVAELHPHRPAVAPKRGCLKSADFYISSRFDESEAGFEDFFDDTETTMKVAEEPPVRFPKKKL
ncbi:type II toxin-antitoxin system Phd/YefM family antitoxin [Luteolibacter flavescens]|uniref:Type II toxin-antitoxin system Phd/YefM family antitoxin n=1 Tax=Luteolibacter flavescens TaxID=1859460 RepID=A0ABT3FI22_9BACT|nr:type II toxin-antitoxin system Phd/YefM family antitoxin [Luteolibacter flavescens]MCW1883224.1 type II toxin-antitoxin system Phd/YefM family antitoxin [Luteolibacter flavescens]